MTLTRHPCADVAVSGCKVLVVPMTRSEQDISGPCFGYKRRIAPMNRREALGALLVPLFPASVAAATPSVSTLIGVGSHGYSDGEVNNPYGLVIGPDQALYFCDLGNQRIRRLDLKSHITRLRSPATASERTAVMVDLRQPPP